MARAITAITGRQMMKTTEARIESIGLAAFMVLSLPHREIFLGNYLSLYDHPSG
jgi:hypothetical protein